MEPSAPRIPIQPAYARRLVRTSALLWLLIRLALILVSGSLVLLMPASLAVVVVTALLAWFDGRRFHEHLFHANLGTPVWLGVLLSLATATVLEAAANGVFIALALP